MTALEEEEVVGGRITSSYTTFLASQATPAFNTWKEGMECYKMMSTIDGKR